MSKLQTPAFGRISKLGWRGEMFFSDKLGKNRFVVTSEVQVSSEADTEGVLGGLQRIRGRIDGLIVAETEIEGVACDSIPVCNVLRGAGYDPLFETTTREKNRIELQNQLLRASEAGIGNVLAFTRDYRITGDSLNEMMFFHVDSAKLFSVVSSLKDGLDVKGKELQTPCEFSVGAGIDAGWGKRVPDLELREIERMVELGTKFFITTPVFDLEEFSQFCSRVKPLGAPIVAEVVLIRSAGMGQLMNKYIRPNLVPPRVMKRLLQAPDKEKESIEVFSELVTGLRELCDGVHIVPFGAEDRVGAYLSAIKR
jgi:methylenetetrahydrofolate reductase (NADPH)